MTKFCVYFQDEENPCVGTDSVLPLDSRYSTSHCIDFVLKHKHTKFMKDNNKTIGFKIGAGRILDNIYITDLIKL